MGSYTNLYEQNVTNLSGLFIYVKSNVPIFPQLLLLSIWIIISFGGYFAQKRTNFTGDLFGSAVIGAWVTTICAVILSMVQVNNIYFVDIFTVLTCLGITIVLSIIFFTRDNDI